MLTINNILSRRTINNLPAFRKDMSMVCFTVNGHPTTPFWSVFSDAWRVWATKFYPQKPNEILINSDGHPSEWYILHQVLHVWVLLILLFRNSAIIELGIITHCKPSWGNQDLRTIQLFLRHSQSLRPGSSRNRHGTRNDYSLEKPSSGCLHFRRTLTKQATNPMTLGWL